MATAHRTTVTTQTIQTKQQRRIIERFSIILVCCGIILSGALFRFC